MAPALQSVDRKRALAALKDAEQFIQCVKQEISDDALTLLDRVQGEFRKVQQAQTAFVLAIIKEEYAPAELYRPFASVEQIRKWRDDPKVKLDVVIKNGRCAVKPSAFFAHWKTLKK